MKNETTVQQEETTFSDLLNEFEFEVPGVKIDQEDRKIPIEDDEDLSEAEKLEAQQKEEEAKKAEEVKKAAEEANKQKKEKEAPKGEPTSFYKNVALKYIESGKWDSNLAIEDSEGNQIPIEDLEDLDEDTFFEIEKAMQESQQEDLKSKYVPISDLDDRKKNLITIIREGGELSEIFKSQEQVDEYLNPFAKLDLDDERVQERVLLNALINHNKLDQESAQAVVNKAKKDLNLDAKVKDYVEGYTKSFDKYVEDRKNAIIKENEDRRKQTLEFKKALTEQYKTYELKDTLVRKLTDSVIKETEEGYQIDSIYDQKMKDPVEAAELILFLNDKEAYLENKLKASKISQQKETRRLIKMIPKEKTAKATTSNQTQASENDFEFQVINK